MTLEIISAEKILFKGEAVSVTLPGVQGRFTVLRNHAPLISVLEKGKLFYRDAAGHEYDVEIAGGLADVDNNVVSVCVY